jgi:RNase H-fold protein (predicted Holliday junction resolvase)
MILGFDPGRDKCGIALTDDTGRLVSHQVVTSEGVELVLRQCQTDHDITTLVIGNQTTSKLWTAKLRLWFADSVTLAPVDERNSTVEARDRYWQMFPPKGLARLIPQGLRIPPRPVDDIVAILLIERYLSTLCPTPH